MKVDETGWLMSTSHARTRILTFIGSPVIIGLMLFVAQPVTAKTISVRTKTSWKGWTELRPENFPTRVQSIYFQAWKLAIDAENSVRWGNWTVSFPTATPVAWWETRQPDFWLIHIPLRCKNPTTDEYDCTMDLIRYIPVSSWESACSISIPPTHTLYSFTIECPSHLLLEDQKRRKRHSR